mmetsp:Transcript_3038/g.4456  ORF Transcript_3038/g.4456 Transcript_3038/m.4456 type:complete len:126 (-) Transcript_3038:2970-3347(-)
MEEAQLSELWNDALGSFLRKGKESELVDEIVIHDSMVDLTNELVNEVASPTEPINESPSYWSYMKSFPETQKPLFVTTLIVSIGLLVCCFCCSAIAMCALFRNILKKREPEFPSVNEDMFRFTDF